MVSMSSVTGPHLIANIKTMLTIIYYLIIMTNTNNFIFFHNLILSLFEGGDSSTVTAKRLYVSDSLILERCLFSIYGSCYDTQTTDAK